MIPVGIGRSVVEIEIERPGVGTVVAITVKIGFRAVYPYILRRSISLFVSQIHPLTRLFVRERGATIPVGIGRSVAEIEKERPGVGTAVAITAKIGVINL